MKGLILGIWLGILGWIDGKDKEIPMWQVMLGGGVGIGFCIWEARTIESVLVSCLPGVIAIVFAKLTREVMGYGDGMVVAILGFFMPVQQLLSIGMTAFILAGVVALVLLVVFHKNGSYQIPFIPFLCIAYVINVLIKAGGGQL